MTELINGRTPDEIKAGLKHCNETVLTACEVCPYNGKCIEHSPETDAIALIERLESEIDDVLAKVPRWISVEDRLPDHNQRVLAYRAESRDTFEEFRMCCGWAIKGKITHWMPLPEPPEEGKQ